MNHAARTVAHECAVLSHEGRIAFPAVVGRLVEAGIQRYHADLQQGLTTYYAADSGFHVEALLPPTRPIAPAFSGAEVVGALRAVQAGQADYRTFVDRIAAAGCIGYTVFLAGRHVVYFGRAGEQHVEKFPQPAS